MMPRLSDTMVDLKPSLLMMSQVPRLQASSMESPT